MGGIEGAEQRIGGDRKPACVSFCSTALSVFPKNAATTPSSVGIPTYHQPRPAQKVLGHLPWSPPYEPAPLQSFPTLLTWSMYTSSPSTILQSHPARKSTCVQKNKKCFTQNAIAVSRQAADRITVLRWERASGLSERQARDGGATQLPKHLACDRRQGVFVADAHG